MRTNEAGVNGLETLKRASKNPFRAFKPSPNNQNSGAARFTNDGFYPVQHSPKFKLSTSEKAFTMGSCFAREVENALHSIGVDVLLYDFEVPDEYINKNVDRIINAEKYENKNYNLFSIRSVLNKYSPSSMVNEFDRIFVDKEVANEGLIQLPSGLWIDPQASQLKPLPLSDAIIARSLITEATMKVRQADVVFLTLGLTETWRDLETGVFLNGAPAPNVIKAMPNRFRFQNITHEQAIADLRQIIQSIRMNVRADMKFIITVSPVPLGVTFTEKDVVVANSYSKGTLVSAAQSIAEEDSLVDYFPSYEMVTNSPRETTWEPDQVHVLPDVVKQVMKTFKSLYF